MILGTAAYMSPEEAKGRTVDRRAAVWEFGAVLDEMLSGTRKLSVWISQRGHYSTSLGKTSACVTAKSEGDPVGHLEAVFFQRNRGHVICFWVSVRGRLPE